MRRIELIIKDKLPSYNIFYSSNIHWAERKEIADYWHKLIGWEFKKQIGINQIRPFQGKITIYFGFRTKDKKKKDLDNYAIKLIIDGLKKLAFEDDRQIKKIILEDLGTCLGVGEIRKDEIKIELKSYK